MVFRGKLLYTSVMKKIKKEKLPNTINREAKETLGNTPSENPRDGLRSLMRAAKSGYFTSLETEDDNRRTRTRK